MKLDVCDCEILALDSGVITCPVTQDEVPVAFVTIRITGQASPVFSAATASLCLKVKETKNE